MPRNHLILRMCRIDSLTIQPVRYQVKKPHTQNPPRAAVEFDSWGGPSQNTSAISRYGSALICSQQAPNPLPYDADERILIRMVKEIRPPRHAELRVLLVVKPILVEDRHCQFVAHRLELLVEKPI